MNTSLITRQNEQRLPLMFILQSLTEINPKFLHTDNLEAKFVRILNAVQKI
jgi:hypothetical protein